jgi:hypothetical protein
MLICSWQKLALLGWNELFWWRQLLAFQGAEGRQWASFGGGKCWLVRGYWVGIGSVHWNFCVLGFSSVLEYWNVLAQYTGILPIGIYSALVRKPLMQLDLQ